MNPLMLIKFGPYAVIVLLLMALGVQGMRLTHAEQEFTQYKLDQGVESKRLADLATLHRTEAANDFTQAQALLKNEIESGAVYRRCVAAGKCGVRVVAATCPAAGVPTPGEPDGIGTHTIPLASGDAAINDCAITTLMLNKLQADIEAQPGYDQ